MVTTKLLLDWVPAMVPEDNDGEDWKWMTEELGVLIRALMDRCARDKSANGSSNQWYVEAFGLGWRSLSGANLVTISNRYNGKAKDLGLEFLRQVLPDTECRFTVYDLNTGAGLKINNFNHDVPGGEGEWYYAMPIDYMISNGMWWGIEEDRLDMIYEIWEAVLADWEFAFLDVKRKSKDRKTSEMPDFEFDKLFKEFLAQYKLTPTSKMVGGRVYNDLQAFFEKYYAYDGIEDWKDSLGDGVKATFDADLVEYLSEVGMVPTDMDPAITVKLRDIWNEMARQS